MPTVMPTKHTARAVKYVPLVAVLFSATLPNICRSEIGQNMFIGNAKALALGNAVTADPPGIDSVHFNPAGLTRLEKTQYELKGITATFALTGEFTTSQKYEDVLAFNNFNDPYRGTKSNIEGASAIMPFVGIKNVPFIAAPLGGAAYVSPDGRFTIADSVYAPFLLGMHRASDDPGRFSGKRVGLTRLTYFSPSFAYKFTDRLSFGGSVGLSYMGINLDIDLRIPNIAVGAIYQSSRLACKSGLGPILENNFNVCSGEINPFEGLAELNVTLENYISPTFNFGVLWDVNDWLSWGAVYQSGTTDNLKGDFQVKYTPAVKDYLNGLNASLYGRTLLAAAGVPNNVDQDTGSAHIQIQYPQHFSTGVSVKLTRNWKFNTDVKYTDTKVWDHWKVEFDQGVSLFGLIGLAAPALTANSLDIPRGYRSVWTWAFGTEYQITDNLALRVGYEPRKSSIPRDKRDFLIPISDVYLYSTGISYKLDKDTLFDASLALVTSHQYIPADSSTNVNSGGGNNFVYNPYSGMNVKTDLTVVLGEISYRKYF